MENNQKSREPKIISRTAGNVYNKLDKENFLLFPKRKQEPTTFFDKRKVVKETVPKGTDFPEMDIKYCIQQVKKILEEDDEF